MIAYVADADPIRYELRETVHSRMARLLDLKLESDADAVRLVSQGISVHSYRRVADKLHFPANLVAPESTVRRRLSEGRFSEVESERVVRVARVFAEAVELFGDEAMALTWFNTPADYLDGDPPVTPLELAASDNGARLIEARILRTAHGMF
ncbi:antitoxin Xre/MbcA/ParS toxin-binding domain-containing protein [Luteibacter sp. ME-Dv--P-043b]|uniref:antitoxin Xre/MbcA/ParS toxin-binding domain-containing protein n=1 Tax=Luteibacter sp. ME-Dv--P-043b TaxID=3040291 RepID=UPI002554E587|nr:antitoxin Xre/MbcA/ParS toxin-binding domain-containing protein [Luteibacter sp. ME-Dv--P-043b]